MEVCKIRRVAQHRAALSKNIPAKRTGPAALWHRPSQWVCIEGCDTSSEDVPEIHAVVGRFHFMKPISPSPNTCVKAFICDSWKVRFHAFLRGNQRTKRVFVPVGYLKTNKK